MLKTDYIIEGKNAKFDGKVHDVKTSYGSIRINQQNVTFIGRSRLEIYNYKKSQLDSSNTADSMQFAGWCATNNFLPEAIAEYENVLKITEDNFIANIIKQRINSLTEINNPTKPAAQEINHNPTTNLNINSNNDQIKTAKILIDNFKRHVQPILMKNCAIADCHAISKNNVGNAAAKKFILMPTTPDSSVSFSQENLNACLLYIDLEYPMRSSLLNYIVVPHSRYSPPFNVESDEYNKVIAWVQLAAKNMPLIKTGNLAHLFSNARSALPSNPDVANTYITAELNPNTAPARFELPAENTTTNLPAGFREVVNLQNQMNARKTLHNNATKNQPAYQPTTPPTQTTNNIESVYLENNDIDSTDPIIFNRIYHPQVMQ
ncbi:MAG: hypothetical protein LBJ00_03725 [Planctomycetaceae bacterium]|nr:hypothetical protein [Planctomycetaceae bacterium]